MTEPHSPSVSQIDSDIGSAGHAGSRLFPSDELLQFQQHMGILRSSNYALHPLVACMGAAWSIMRQTDRIRQTDMDCVRRFLREDLQPGMDKLLAIGNSSRAYIDDDVAFEALHLLVMLAAAMLEYRQQQSPDVLPELDSDMSPLMSVILSAFNSHRPLHVRFETAEVPQQVVDKYGNAGQDDVQWVQPKDDANMQLQDEDLDDLQDDLQEVKLQWWSHIIQTFGSMRGFEIIIQMLSDPAAVSFNLLNTSLAVLAQVVEEVTAEAKEQFRRVIEPVSTHVLQLVEAGSDRLADHGNDRTYNIFQCLANINLPRVITYGCSQEEALSMRRQLQHIVCTFVSKMLDSSSFNKLLSGARECNKVLSAAVKTQDSNDDEVLLQEMCTWMHDSQIVQRLLRTGLHHKQYMNEVKGVMVTLTRCAELTAEHLDLMWAVTEKEDAYDAVKTHMFDLLAAVASECQPSQLDMLFAKLERRQFRSLQDMERVLSLLESLAESDSEHKMYDKIVQLVWDLTMPADAPPQLLDLRTMEQVVKCYMKDAKPQEYAKTCSQLTQKCFKALKAGQGGQVPLLRTACELLKLLPAESKSKSQLTKTRAVDDLNRALDVTKDLVEAVCSRVALLQSKIAAAAAAAGGESELQAADLAVIKAASMAELDEGSWSYTDIIKELLATLKFLAVTASGYFDEALAEQLWDTLMVNAPTGEDQLPATHVFFRSAFIDTNINSAFFEEPTRRLLLEKHLVKQDVESLSLPTAKLTCDVFTEVNREAEAVRPFNPRKATADGALLLDLEKVTGLDLLWRIYLSNRNEQVATQLRTNLLTLYHSLPVYDNSHAFRRALVEELVSHMRAVVDKLGGSAAEAELAARTVARCLAMANSAVQPTDVVVEATMPPVPAHNRAWRGTPIVLDIQREGAARQRLTSHVNEYVGLLRERLARSMGCSAKSVRMFNMGQELHMDSNTVAESGLHNRAALTVMESPEPNKFTRAPSEYRQEYEMNSFAWMFSQADGVYPLLLRFIDTASETQGIASMALQLLAVLPTYPFLSERLAAALDGPDKQRQLAGMLNSSSNIMLMDAGDQQQQQCAPYQTLYSLQALCALLFPTFDEALLASADREAAAEGSACPSPAAAPAPGAVTPQGNSAQAAADVPVNAADAAAASALQHQHHREVQQQEFLHSKGLEVVLEAAHKAAMNSSADLQLRRQLSELLVVLLHNLLDAAQAWQTMPLAAAAAGNSHGPCTMSGAESGAGQPAGNARHAAPASSLVGACGAANAPVESVSMPMAGVQQAADPAGSSAALGDSHDGVQQPCSKAAATTSDTACHHPSSPAMEVSSPLPGQQQQSGKQRQRGGDLPPLPPQGQQQQPQQLAAGNAAAGGPGLAANFSSQTLKLIADTLLGVAVDTSQLWGCDAAAAAEALADEDSSSKDVAVAREALQLLLRVLEQHPPLLQPLLLDVEQPPLVCTVLLSPYYAALRHQAADLLEKLVSNDSNRQRLLPWLLMQLAAARPLVQQRPASCGNFYTLLSNMLMKLGQCWGMLPEQLFAVANDMLDEEVTALQTIAAAGPVPSAHNPSKQQHLQRRRRRRQQLASPEDASAVDEQQAEPGACSLLQGRLQLILALVRVLDRRAVGSEGQGALMKLLLHEFLFPEAVQKMAAATGQLNLQRCVSSLEPHCATPSCRKAALELLAELMGDAPSSLEEGVNMLLALHYQEQVLRNYGMVPRTLRGPGQYAGVRNGGATCYMNAVFQQLFMQPGIRTRILGSDEVAEAEKDSSVFAQLQGLFAQLALSKSTFAQPYRFWAAFKDYDGTPIDVREHQDAYEFFTRLQDFVDQHLISTGQEPAIKPVMGGAFVQQIICRGHDFTSERNEDFYQISVEVKGMGTLEKSLDDYVKGELMEGDNAYLCEELGKRVPAVKRTAIRTLPQMLCIHLKRFEFDYHNQTRHKLRDRFEFPLELDMFAYTAEGLAAADQQQKAAEEQQQQDGQPGQQQQQRPLRPSSSSGAAVAGPLHPAYMYDLHGVVVHSGSAFTGHYYSYIKERAGSSSTEQGPRWFCFDDKDVSLWDESNLEVDCFGGKTSQDFDAHGFRPQRNEYERAHSAYMLFYERREAPAVGTDVATSKHSQQQQQSQAQQQPAACAAADTDVEMETGDAPLQAAANAVSSQQQHELQQPGFSIPYGMPESLFREVVEQNIFLIWNTHVLDKDYFRFVRQLVDSRGDLGQLTTRKSRRRDGAAAAGGLNPAVLASGSSDRVHSSMVCDTSTPQQPQQHQPCPSTGSGALPMQISPTPTPTPSTAPQGAAGASAAVPGPLELPGNGPPPAAAADMQQSPGPSSRRGEEAEAVAQALMRLGVLFQFEVYLHAADSLRSESNVWTEALRSLMGSGSSSTACMQVFLELVQMHPRWLRSYLVECNSTGQNCPRRWASDMLAWTLTAASKRCGPQLQAYVSLCLQARPLVYQDPSVVTPQTVQHFQIIEQQLRVQQLPPLGQALVGVVQQLVLLVQGCLLQVDQMAQVVSDHDIPSEPARVLLAYAESSPWAAAHLLEVFNVVPDLEQHITTALSPEPEDDFTHEELVPLYELLDEVVSFASNLPQLTAELNGKRAVNHNSYIRYLPGSNGASSSGSGNSAGSTDPAAGPAGLHCTLSPSSYRKLMGRPVLEGMANSFVCMSPRVVHLAGLLSFNNEEAIRALVNTAASELFWMLRRNQQDAPNDGWEVVCRNLGVMQLQPDDFVEKRVHFWAYGQWHNLDAQHAASTTAGVLAYPGPITFAALYGWQVLRAVVKYYREQQTPQAHCILHKMGKLVRLYQHRMLNDLHAMIQFLRRQPEQAPAAYAPMLEEALEMLNWLSQQGQQQQQHLAAVQQQQLQEADDDAAAEGSP